MENIQLQYQTTLLMILKFDSSYIPELKYCNMNINSLRLILIIIPFICAIASNDSAAALYDHGVWKTNEST